MLGPNARISPGKTMDPRQIEGMSRLRKHCTDSFVSGNGASDVRDLANDSYQLGQASKGRGFHKLGW